MVEATMAPPLRRCGDPRDDVDMLVLDESGHGCSQRRQGRPVGAVLQAGDELATDAVVGQDGRAPVEARGTPQHRRGMQLRGA